MQVYTTQTYIKVVDDRVQITLIPNRNKIETRHVTGTNYTDILARTILDYGEPLPKMQMTLHKTQKVILCLMN